MAMNQRGISRQTICRKCKVPGMSPIRARIGKIHFSYLSFPIPVSTSVLMRLARDVEEDSETSVSPSSASGDDMG